MIENTFAEFSAPFYSGKSIENGGTMQTIEEIIRGPISSGSMRVIYEKLNASYQKVAFMHELYDEFPQYAPGTVRWAVSKLVKNGHIHTINVNGYNYYGSSVAIGELKRMALMAGLSPKASENG